MHFIYWLLCARAVFQVQPQQPQQQAQQGASSYPAPDHRLTPRELAKQLMQLIKMRMSNIATKVGALPGVTMLAECPQHTCSAISCLNAWLLSRPTTLTGHEHIIYCGTYPDCPCHLQFHVAASLYEPHLHMSSNKSSSISRWLPFPQGDKDVGMLCVRTFAVSEDSLHGGDDEGRVREGTAASAGHQQAWYVLMPFPVSSCTAVLPGWVPQACREYFIMYNGLL